MSLITFMKRARWVKFFLPFLVGVLPALAAPPASVAGMIYYEMGYTFVTVGFSHGLMLNADGTYRAFYRASSRQFAGAAENPTTFPQGLLTYAEEGTWTYRVLDERTAELEFRGINVEKRTLTFTTGTTGGMSGGSPIHTGEFKLVSPEARAPLVNSSNRSFVPAGKSALVGFVVTERNNRVLVRAVGPGLGAFGVAGTLARPTLQVVSARGTIAEGNRWTERSAEMIRRTSALVGAFPLEESSADAALILTLPPYAYTVRVAGATAEDSGEVLIEVYILP